MLGVRASKSRPDLGIVHVQSTARKNVGESNEAVVLSYQRKVQVFKHEASAERHLGEVEAEPVDCPLWLPSYDPGADYK